MGDHVIDDTDDDQLYYTNIYLDQGKRVSVLVVSLRLLYTWHPASVVHLASSICCTPGIRCTSGIQHLLHSYKEYT